MEHENFHGGAITGLFIQHQELGWNELMSTSIHRYGHPPGIDAVFHSRLEG